ncbi:MAG: hypothetical protein AAFX02_11140 [Pseudomonadota bacterium]
MCVIAGLTALASTVASTVGSVVGGAGSILGGIGSGIGGLAGAGGAASTAAGVASAAAGAVPAAATAASGGVSLGTVLSGVGAATGALGSVVGGIASNRAAKFNAKVQENNAIHLRRLAQTQEQTARLDIVRRQREIAQAVGARSALIGASGVEQTSGSALSTLVSDIEQGALDVAILRSNADQQIQDLIFQSDDLRRQAKLTRQEGRFAMGGSVLSGASQVGGFLGKLDWGKKS